VTKFYTCDKIAFPFAAALKKLKKNSGRVTFEAPKFFPVFKKHACFSVDHIPPLFKVKIFMVGACDTSVKRKI
jgi:hypothetical protein